MSRRNRSKKRVLAGIGAIIFAGAVYSQETAQTTPTYEERTLAHETPTQETPAQEKTAPECTPITRVQNDMPAKQRYNYSRHGITAVQKIERFSPLLYTEWVCGELHLELAIIEANDIPNAYYDDITKTILVECAPQYSECYTDAVEHELGHHIDPGEGLDDFFSSLETRMLHEDFEEFNEALMKSSWAISQEQQLIAQGQAIMSCMNLAYTREYAKELLAIGEMLIPDSIEYAVFKTAYAEYDAASGCTTELLLWLEDQRERTWAGLAQIKEFHDTVYYRREARAENPLISHIEVPIESAYQCAQMQYALASKALTEKIRKEYLPNLPEQKIIIEHIPALMMHTDLGKRNTHDEYPAEKFASAVDSLVTLYAGPVTWAPWKFTLSPELVYILADVEYKGEKILSPWAGRYMLNPAVQEYWREHGLK